MDHPQSRSCHKLRNISLVKTSDPDYQVFVNDIRQNKRHIRPVNKRPFSDLISYPMEKAIRNWIGAAGGLIEERILSYEIFFQGKYVRRFRELDAVFLRNGVHWFVEIKVSSSSKSVRTGYDQLNKSYNIFRRKCIDCELLVIHVDLNYMNNNVVFEPFEDNFFDMQLLPVPHYFCFYLRLLPQYIFDWGVNSGAIQDTNLLTNAINEKQSLDAIRTQRKKLKEKGIPSEQWPGEIQIDVQQKNGSARGDFLLVDPTATSRSYFADMLKNALKGKGSKRQ